MTRRTFDRFLEAANNGVAVAQWKVANCYLQGRFVERHPQEALRWLELAAAAALPLAQRDLGAYLCNTGESSEVREQGMRLLERAAQRNSAAAVLLIQYWRTMMLDMRDANRLLTLTHAAARCIPEARFIKGWLEFFRYPGTLPSIGEMYTQIHREAAGGNHKAKVILGEALTLGYPCQIDLEQASRVLAEALEEPRAATLLARTLQDQLSMGIEVTGGSSRVWSLLSEAAAAGHMLGKADLLALRYETSDVTPEQKSAIANELASLAVQTGCSEVVQRALPYVYQNRRTIPCETVDEIHQLARNFEFSDGFSHAALIEIERGNNEKALKFLFEGVNAGSPACARHLGEQARKLLSDKPRYFRHFWLENAIDDGVEFAESYLAYELSNDQLSTDETLESLSMLWSLQGRGNEYATMRLASLCRSGRGMIRNQRVCADLLESQAKQDNAKCQWNLGVAFQNGEGRPVDKARADYWFARSIATETEQGDLIESNDDETEHLAKVIQFRRAN